MHYPHIDPVIVGFGPVAVRWYGLAYLDRLRRRVVARQPPRARPAPAGPRSRFPTSSSTARSAPCSAAASATCSSTASNSFSPIRCGCCGSGKAACRFTADCSASRLRSGCSHVPTHRTFLQVSDFVAPLVPPGLGFGRLGNFANTELPGRMTDSAFGMIYPCHCRCDPRDEPAVHRAVGGVRAAPVAAVPGVRRRAGAVRDRLAVFFEAARDRRGLGRVPDRLRAAARHDRDSSASRTCSSASSRSTG